MSPRRAVCPLRILHGRWDGEPARRIYELVNEDKDWAGNWCVFRVIDGAYIFPVDPLFVNDGKVRPLLKCSK